MTWRRCTPSVQASVHVVYAVGAGVGVGVPVGVLEDVEVSALELPRFLEPDAGQHDGVVSHTLPPRLLEPDAG